MTSVQATKTPAKAATLEGTLAHRRALTLAQADAHSLRLLSPNTYGLHAKAAVVDAPAIDTRRMCVPCTITTQDEDRYGDIVVTAGLDCSLHQANPVVLLNHGHGGGTPLDVARAEDDAGRYTVAPDHQGGRARAVSWFSGKVQDSEQVFGLIQEGMLRGVSIGFRIRRFECRKAGVGVAGPVGGFDAPGVAGGLDGGPGLLIAESELVEYSHCPIGVNPYALVDRVVGKSVCGRPLSERIMKSLSPHFPPLKEQVAGGFGGGFDAAAVLAAVEKGNHLLERIASLEISLEGGPEDSMTTPTTATSKKKAAPVPTRKKAEGMTEEEGAGGGYVAVDDGTQDPQADDAEVLDEEAAEDELADEEDPTKDWLPGAKVLAGVHGALALAGMAIEGGYASQENENVKAALDGIAEGVTSAMASAEECFKGQYPDYGPLGGEKADEADEGDEEVEEKSEGEDADEEGGEDDVEEKSFSQRLTPAGKALAKRLRKAYRAVTGRNVATSQKRLSKGVATICSAAADCFAELAEHMGEMKGSQRTACGAHARSLRELAAEPVEDDSQGEKSLKAASARIAALEAENKAIKEASAALLKEHKALQKAARKHLNDRKPAR